METTTFWRDLEARFRELLQEELRYPGQGALAATWDRNEGWLSGSSACNSQHVRTNFERLAKSAAVRLGHAGGPTALFFWLDLLKAESGAYLPSEPNGGRIELVCKVSAEYCLECENQEIAKKQASESAQSKNKAPQPQPVTVTNDGEAAFQWDLFICHASEDKQDFVRPLAEALRQKNLKVWYDETALILGESLQESIDRGLRESRFGVVVLSHAFFTNNWTRRELDGLVALERNGRKVILPIWHNLTRDDVCSHSPTLAGRYAALSSEGIDMVATRILDAIQRDR